MAQERSASRHLRALDDIDVAYGMLFGMTNSNVVRENRIEAIRTLDNALLYLDTTEHKPCSSVCAAIRLLSKLAWEIENSLFEESKKAVSQVWYWTSDTQKTPVRIIWTHAVTHAVILEFMQECWGENGLEVPRGFFLYPDNVDPLDYEEFLD
jgi:hypothetical protein